MADGFSLDLRTLGIFLLITVAMGGGAAWMTGSGLARGWRPFWHCALALLLIAAVVTLVLLFHPASVRWISGDLDASE